MAKIKIKLINLFIIFFLVIIFSSVFFVWFIIYTPKNSYSQEKINFSIRKGETVEEISLNLKKQGLIRYSFPFLGYIFLKEKEKEIKAGEYELSPAMNIIEIANKIVSGDRIKKTITIVEGWTIEDIESYFKKNGLLKEGEKINDDLEGYLFPDTYEILPGEDLNEIIDRIHYNFEKKVESKFKEEIALKNKTLSEIVIMASILEKEVKTFEDKKVVSGILWKRLKMGMLLQVDAFLDTYKTKGLPSKPICNPGLESIEAAIFPQESPYFYYLSAYDGKTIFSKTLKEHNLAIEKYLKNKKVSN